MGVFSGRTQYELVVNGFVAQTNASTNTSEVGWQLIARVRSGQSNPGTFSTDPVGTYSLSMDGQTWSGNWTPDFRSTNQILIAADGKIVTHDADGSKAVTFNFSANSNNAIGSASDSVNLTLTDFVRLPSAPGAPSLSRTNNGSTLNVTSQVASSFVTVSDYQYRFSYDNANWSFEQAMGTSRVASLAVANTDQFFVQTRAYSTEGWGQWSASAFIGGVPSAPASIAATRTGRNVTVTISGSATGNGGGIGDYFVQASSDNGATWGTAQNINSGNYTYTNLTAGATFYFRTYVNNTIGSSAFTTSGPVFIPAGGRRWTGSSWTSTTTAKRWNGSAWVDLTIAKRWNGSAWIDLS